MNTPVPTSETLREAFAALSVHAKAAPGCPEPGRIWAATYGELSPADTHDLVDHIFVCAACAEAWRLASDLSPHAAPTTHVVAPARGIFGVMLQHRGAFAASLAAMLVVAVGGFYVLQRAPQTEQSVYRQPDAVAIRSLLDERTPLPREQCVLRWSPGPDGTKYRVRVAGEDLRLISLVQDLEAAEYQVPASALASLPTGARLLWQVEASMPDGRRAVSPTFIAAVQ